MNHYSSSTSGHQIWNELAHKHNVLQSWKTANKLDHLRLYSILPNLRRVVLFRKSSMTRVVLKPLPLHLKDGDWLESGRISRQMRHELVYDLQTINVLQTYTWAWSYSVGLVVASLSIYNDFADLKILCCARFVLHLFFVQCPESGIWAWLWVLERGRLRRPLSTILWIWTAVPF